MEDTTGSDSHTRFNSLLPEKHPGVNANPTHASSDENDVHQSSLKEVGSLFAERYIILGELGRGGMGCVYRVQNKLNGQIRVVKVLHRRLLHDADSLRRFQQEVVATSRITSANAVTIIDSGVSQQGEPFLVMEYAEGVTLADLLRSRVAFSIDHSIEIFLQICSALEDAHLNGVIHRDIKPSNIFITTSKKGCETVKVLDFGIAKVLPQSNDGTVASTQTGEIFGSPPYMSPEQCLGQTLDHRSDIYSLGCLMYEVLTGASPFVGESKMSTMYKQINEVSPPLHGLNLNVRAAEHIDKIIRKALNKNPEDRFQSIADLAEELRKFSQNSEKGIAFYSMIALESRKLQYFIYNKIGTSRRVLLGVFIFSLLGLVPLSYFLAPYVMMRIPQRAEVIGKWQSSPYWSSASKYTQDKFTAKEVELRQRLDDPSIASVEAIASCRQLGDMYFDNSAYSLAAVRYQEMSVLASKGLQEHPQNTGAVGPLMHECAYALGQYSRCLLHLKDYKSALKEAKEGLRLSFYDTSRDDRYKIFFAEVIGVSEVRLTGQASQKTNDYLHQFQLFVSKKGLGSQKPSELADAMADIGDCYFLCGQWERAISAYEMSSTYWRNLIDPNKYNRDKSDIDRVERYKSGANERDKKMFALRGDFALFNSSVASIKIGRAQIKLGDYFKAREAISKAIAGFESWGGADCAERTTAMLELADIEWRMHNFLGSWMLKAQALRQLKNHGAVQKSI